MKKLLITISILIKSLLKSGKKTFYLEVTFLVAKNLKVFNSVSY